MGRALWKRRRPLSLRGTLTLLFLLMPTIAIGLVTIFSAISYRRTQRDALIEEARTILALLVQHHPKIARGTSNPQARLKVWSGRVAELPVRQPRITYAVLVDAAGADLSAGRLRAKNLVRATPEHAVVDPDHLSLMGAPPIAHVAARIPDAPGAIVQIGLRAGPGWAHLAHLEDIAAVLAITLVLNIWIIRRGLRHLLVPLEDIASESVALAQGRQARHIVVRGPEEIRHVASAFNKMVERGKSDASRIDATLQELRAQQEAADFERQRFMAMVEALHEGLLFLGDDGRVAYANPESGRILGRSASSLAELSVPTEYLKEKSPDADALLGMLLGFDDWRAIESRSSLDLTLVTLPAGAQEPGGRMILLRDRTEERKLERLMAEQDKIASIGMLAAGIAHEINNPLDGLQNCLRRIIKDPENTEQIERYAGLMTASLHHIETVVRQLLNLSHKRDRSVRKVDLNETVRGAADLARTGQRWHGIEVDWHLESELPLVLADPQNLAQIFLNLVLNAVDAMPTGGTLTVTTRPVSSRGGGSGEADVLVEIRDTGVGISPEDLPRIFEPFFTTKGSEKGTGLGLSVSRNLVVEHGGEINVVSAPGVGTTFSVRLPRFFPVRSGKSVGTESSS